jgi:hypothetical protein
VFGNYPKYNLPLTLSGARQLLYSLHSRYPLSDTITCSALWRAYKLPPLSSDPASSAILAATCLKHNSKESNVIGHELLQQLPNILPKELKPRGLNDMARYYLHKGMGELDRSSRVGREEYEWVREFRTMTRLS